MRESGNSSDLAKGVLPTDDFDEQSGKKKSRSWSRIFLIVTCIASGSVLLFPELPVTLLELTLFAIPISIYLLLAPPLAFYLLLFWGLHSLLCKLSTTRWMPISASLILGAAVLVVPPYLGNQTVGKLTARDHDNLFRPVKVKTIALRDDALDATKCGGFCLYALLGGAAEQVFMLQSSRDDLLGDVTTYQEGAAYRLIEQRDCEITDHLSPNSWMGPQYGQTPEGQSVNLIGELRRRVSQGECLVKREDIDLGQADLIISLTSERSRKEYSRFSFRPYLTSLDRILVHQPGENEQGMTEVYRWTGGIVAWMPPVLVFHPDLSFFPGGSKADWLRRKGPIAEGHGRLEEQTWSHFLEEILQFRLPTPDEHPA